MPKIIFQPLMIWNPALKNVLTYLGSADLQSAAKESAFPFVVLGDYKSPGFNRSNLFLRRITNPPGRLAGDFLFDACRETFF